MRWQRSATRVTFTKVLKGLALAALFKILLLVVVAMQAGEATPPAYAQNAPAAQPAAQAPAPAPAGAAAQPAAAPGKAAGQESASKQQSMEELDRKSVV